jgi:hypothetical protein
LTIVLLVLAVALAIFFARLRTGTDSSGAAATVRGPWRWTWQNLFPAFFIAIAGWFIWRATGFEPKAGSFPVGLGVLVIVLALAQVVLNGWQRGTGDVLDLGMLSAGVEGRGRSALLLGGLLMLFVILAALVGLQYASIVLAALSPAALMTGRHPWAWGLLTGGIIAAAVFGFFDHVMSMIWPEPILGEWIQNLLS